MIRVGFFLVFTCCLFKSRPPERKRRIKVVWVRGKIRFYNVSSMGQSGQGDIGQGLGGKERIGYRSWKRWQEGYLLL